MGRELQKRKRRSSRPKVRPHNPRKKQLNPQSNSIIAKNWNKKETLTQNYRRLGLVARLNGPTGGTERARLLAAAAAAGGDEPKDSGFGGDEDFSAGFGGVRKKHKLAGGDGVAVDPGATPFAIGGVASQEVVREARVERDPETGRIVRVIHDNGSGRAGSGGLDDPLNGLDSDESDEDEDHEKKETTAGAFQHPIVAQLEAQAAEVRPTKKRHQSQREREWLAKLVAKHGWGNEAAMARDRVLNPFQQTEADLRRRLKIWREQEGGEV